MTNQSTLKKQEELADDTASEFAYLLLRADGEVDRISEEIIKLTSELAAARNVRNSLLRVIVGTNEKVNAV